LKNYSSHFLALTFVLITGCAHQFPDYAVNLSSRLPTPGKAEAIGDYSLGCLKGGETFTGKENGLYLSQKKRGRYWGHPDLIKLLTKAGSEFYKNHKQIIVGDMSQSRGGPTITGHHSHQNGLDVDIWFKVPPAQEELTFSALETEEMKSVESLNDDHKNLIRFFANDPSVERIFINPSFKKQLCSDNGPLRLSPEQQHKMRAWWGHDDHIHVRLKCPSDSPECLSQKPVPQGDGCGEDLNWWFGEEAKASDVDASWNDLKSIFLDKVKSLPEHCSFYKDIF